MVRLGCVAWRGVVWRSCVCVVAAIHCLFWRPTNKPSNERTDEQTGRRTRTDLRTPFPMHGETGGGKVQDWYLNFARFHPPAVLMPSLKTSLPPSSAPLPRIPLFHQPRQADHLSPSPAPLPFPVSTPLPPSPLSRPFFVPLSDSGRPSKLPVAATPSARPCARPSASSGASWRGLRRRTLCPTSSPLCSRKPAWKACP